MYFMSLGSQSAAEDFNKLLKPTGSWNTSKYTDAELVAMIDEFAAASADEQPALAQEINRYVVDNAWFAPVYYEMTILASNPAVGFTPHSQYVVPFIRDYYHVDQ
jgi:peptide/nickel transport system substrate-binding protein